MKKTLVWLLALLLTAALPASAAERFEVTDGVYVALPGWMRSTMRCGRRWSAPATSLSRIR